MALSSYRIPFLIPYFVETQRKSFLNLLNTGLIVELLKKNPIREPYREFKMKFYPHYYQLNLPDYTPKTAILQYKTYSSKVYIPIQYINCTTKRSKMQWMILANLPLMTKRGNFIVNGSPKVIVNQIVRSPGIYYKKIIDELNRETFYADLISQRGAWLRFEIDKKKRFWIQMKKTRKIPILIFLKALGINDFQQKEIIKYPKFLETSKTLTEAIKRENYIHPETSTDSLMWIYTFVYPDRWTTPPIPKRVLKKAKKFLFRKFFNSRTYDLGYSGRTRLNKKFNRYVSSIKTDFYTRNKKTFVLNNQDFLFIVDYLIKVEKNMGFLDDIDHLKNRRVRTSGELIQNIIGTGLIQLEKTVRDKISRKLSNKNIVLSTLFTPKPVDRALKEFFGSSPLAQFMDETNPLAELTHKRRVSSLGPGGITRQTSGMDIRGIHSSHYGRICPIETPEGRNAGLVNSLTTLAKVNEYGFIETPLYKIYKNQVQKWKLAAYFSPTQEQCISIAPGDIKLNYFFFLDKKKIFAKYNNEFKKVYSNKIEYMCVSVIQMISIATSLIPFLEHDDANRALMGSNMQRQAVPLILPDKPIIGTGFENKVVCDCGHGVQSRTSGKVFTINSKNIMVTNFESNTIKIAKDSETQQNHDLLLYRKYKSNKVNLKKKLKKPKKTFKNIPDSRILSQYRIEDSFKPYNYLYCYKKTKKKTNYQLENRRFSYVKPKQTQVKNFPQKLLNFSQNFSFFGNFIFSYTYDLIKKKRYLPKRDTISISSISQTLFFQFLFFFNINYNKNQNFYYKTKQNSGHFHVQLNFFDNYTTYKPLFYSLKKKKKTETKTEKSALKKFKKFIEKILENFEKNNNITDQNFIISNIPNFDEKLSNNFCYLFACKNNEFYLRVLAKKKHLILLNNPLNNALNNPLNNALNNFESFFFYFKKDLTKFIFKKTFSQIIVLFLNIYIKLIFLQNFIEKKNIKHIFFYTSLNWQNFNVQKFSKTRYFNKNNTQMTQCANFFKNPNFLGYSIGWYKNILKKKVKKKKKRIHYSKSNHQKISKKTFSSFSQSEKLEKRLRCKGFVVKSGALIVYASTNFSEKKIKLNCTKIKKFKNLLFEFYIKKKCEKKSKIFKLVRKQNFSKYFSNIFLLNNKIIINSPQLCFHLNRKPNLFYVSKFKLKNIVSPLFQNKLVLAIFKIQKKNLGEKVIKYFISILYNQQLNSRKIVIADLKNIEVLLYQKSIKKFLFLWNSETFFFNFNEYDKNSKIFPTVISLYNKKKQIAFVSKKKSKIFQQNKISRTTDSFAIKSFSLFKDQNKIKNFTIKPQFRYLNKIINYCLLTYAHSNQKTCINQTSLVSSGEWVQKGDLLADGAASAGSELAIGQSILVAYMPWEGYNFEDAVLINERLIYDDLYTSIHIQKYAIEIYNTEYGPERFTRKIPYVSHKQTLNLNLDGIIKVGSWVSEGDILVGKVTPQEKKRIVGYKKLLRDILEKRKYVYSLRDTSLRVPKHVSGRIVHVEKINNEEQLTEKKKQPKKNVLTNPKRIQIYIAEKRKIQVGDKVSGRHGNKGIISNILPRQDMPYILDGTPIDMVLNPLGVPSRMNVGQVFECLLGLAASELHEHVRMTIFDEINGTEATRSLAYSKLFDARVKTGKQWLFNPESPGKMTVFDGRTGECFEQKNTVGTAYMLKLVHLVDEKIHARSTGPYSLVTQQPVRGRSKHGGQRLGEMEVWALEGFGAAYTLHELLTSKSDDIRSRKKITDSIIKRGSIVRYTPEAFKVLVSELQSLCITLGIYKINNFGETQPTDLIL